jgi:hypothetical protein
MNETHERLRAAFHRVTMTLLGLFEVYQADPELVDHAAEELEAIFREHLDGGTPASGARGKLALERLLDELEAAGAAKATH